MRKPKNKTKLQAIAKRGLKRSTRLKKTQAEKGRKKLKLVLEKKLKEQKFQESLRKLMEARMNQHAGK